MQRLGYIEKLSASFRAIIGATLIRAPGVERVGGICVMRGIIADTRRQMRRGRSTGTIGPTCYCEISACMR